MAPVYLMLLAGVVQSNSTTIVDCLQPGFPQVEMSVCLRHVRQLCWWSFGQ